MKRVLFGARAQPDPQTLIAHRAPAMHALTSANAFGQEPFATRLTRRWTMIRNYFAARHRVALAEDLMSGDCDERWSSG
jgi:hypothetical protein